MRINGSDRAFSETCWGTRPSTLGIASLPSLAITSRTLLKALAQLHSARQTNQQIREATDYSGLGIDGASVDEWDANLPHRTSAGFDDYAKELLNKYHAKEFFLLVNNFQCVVPELFKRCCVELRNLLGTHPRNRIEVAKVRSPVTLTVVVSNCLTSPTGIHMDPNHAFLHPILGEKRIRFWPLRAIKKDQVGSRNIGSLRAASRVIDAGPEGLIYWPANWWHIADEKSRKTRAALVLCIEARDGVRKL